MKLKAISRNVVTSIFLNQNLSFIQIFYSNGSEIYALGVNQDFEPKKVLVSFFSAGYLSFLNSVDVRKHSPTT